MGKPEIASRRLLLRLEIGLQSGHQTEDPGFDPVRAQIVLRMQSASEHGQNPIAVFSDSRCKAALRPDDEDRDDDEVDGSQKDEPPQGTHVEQCRGDAHADDDQGGDERWEQSPGHEVTDVIGIGDHGAQCRVRGQQPPIAHADAFEVLPQPGPQSRECGEDRGVELQSAGIEQHGPAESEEAHTDDGDHEQHDRRLV